MILEKVSAENAYVGQPSGPANTALQLTRFTRAAERDRWAARS